MSEQDKDGMRTACDPCSNSKVGCKGGHPCARCKRRGTDCVYSEKRRCGPKKKKRSLEDMVGERMAGGNYSGGGGGLSLLLSYGGDSVRASAATLQATLPTAREHELLRVYLQHVNTFLPLTTPAVLRDALNPVPLDFAAGTALAGASMEAEAQRFHARKAVLWAAIALGGLFVDDEASAEAACQRARSELKECFDASSPELLSAYLMMSLYWLHHLDSAKVLRFAGFAQQASRELKDVPSDLAACLQFLSVVFRIAGLTDTVGCRVEEPQGPGGRDGPKASVVRLISTVLLSLFNAYDPAAEPQGKDALFEPGSGGSGSSSQGPYGLGLRRAHSAKGPDPAAGLLMAGGTNGRLCDIDDGALLNLISQAERLLLEDEQQGEMLTLAIKGLKGFFLLRCGRQEAALATVEPLADLVSDWPVVLHFPLTWILARSVLAMLQRFDRRIAAERMMAAMSPFYDSFKYAMKCCSVGALLLETYTQAKDSGEATAAAIAISPRKATLATLVQVPLGFGAQPHPLADARWVSGACVGGMSSGSFGGADSSMVAFDPFRSSSPASFDVAAAGVGANSGAATAVEEDEAVLIGDVNNGLVRSFYGSGSMAGGASWNGSKGGVVSFNDGSRMGSFAAAPGSKVMHAVPEHSRLMDLRASDDNLVNATLLLKRFSGSNSGSFDPALVAGAAANGSCGVSVSEQLSTSDIEALESALRGIEA